jgi:hypothetical protein
MENPVADEIKWPELKQGDPLEVVKWARDLIKVLRALVAPSGEGNGKDGAPGPKGEDGGTGPYEVLDVDLSTGSYAIDKDDVCKVIYAKSSYSGTCAVTGPESNDGEWIVFIHYAQATALCKLSIAFGTGGGLGMAAMDPHWGVQMWANGMGGWDYVQLKTGAPGTRT